MRPDPDYEPLEERSGDELFPNGIFVFNITRIEEDIQSGRLLVDEVDIDVIAWKKSHTRGGINEAHMFAVNLGKPIIIAEISPERYEVIDGHHRMEKARRENEPVIKAYRLRAEQLLPYFTEKKSYFAYIDFWNGKLTDA